jgi:tetratricopeptide (TPR) repeat protein
MSNFEEPSDDHERSSKIRSMVRSDYERISNSSDPFVILNLSEEASLEEVRSRYARYEKFYRAENFQRFGDMDLTRKALDVRRAIGRAMATIESKLAQASGPGDPSDDDFLSTLPEVDDDCAALGDIYFRDGLTYLKLRDLNAAEECLQRAVDYDPSRGIILAYLSYTQFKLRRNDPSVVDESRWSLQRAARMEPDNAEVYVLLTRFGINAEEADLASEAIAQLEELRPNHPRLDKLKKRLSRLN